MSTENRNTVSPIAALVAGAMKDESTALNRSATLIAHMFATEATFSAASIAAVIRLKGSDLTDKLDKDIAEVSPEYEAAMSYCANISDKKAAERSEHEKSAVDVYKRQMRAARMLYQRALTATFGLRKNNALEVSAAKKRTGLLLVEYLKEKTKDGKLKTVDKEQSCADLIRCGEEALVASNVKTKRKEQTARNPAANVMADASKSLAAVLSSQAASGKRQAMTDFADAIEKDMETTLRELFAMKFADDRGMIDGKAVSAWVADTFKSEKQEAAKQNAGTKDAKVA